MRLVSLLFCFVLALASCETRNSHQQKSTIDIDTIVEAEKQLFFGFDMDSFNIQSDTIKRGKTISDVLIPRNYSQVLINTLYNKTKDTFDISRVRAGDVCHTLYNLSDTLPKFMVYEINAKEYALFNIDSLSAKIIELPVTERIIVVKGKINKGESISSVLSDSISDYSLALALENQMINIFAWSVDFFHIQPNDEFQIIANVNYVDSNFVGLKDVVGVSFVHYNDTINAVYFENGETSGFFDENGDELRKAFLKAPLRFSRISSRYTKKRYHPVQKRFKAHLGTDFAAPTGTPIWAAADGVVIASTYSKFNGNYVKIRHNSTYSTQYLHMSKRGRGIVVGKKVKQGDVIGYVGSTGLASGPHLCYRFWKNGKQVDPRNEKFESVKQIPDSLKMEFEKVYQSFQAI